MPDVKRAFDADDQEAKAATRRAAGFFQTAMQGFVQTVEADRSASDSVQHPDLLAYMFIYAYIHMCIYSYIHMSICAYVHMTQIHLALGICP